MPLTPTSPGSGLPPDGLVTRRQLLRMAGGATAGIVLSSCMPGSGSGTTETAPTVSGSATTAVDTATSLRATESSVGALFSIPERLAGTTFDLDMAVGQREFLAGISTATKGYNGDFLGPTVFVRAGEDIELNVTNNIGHTTTTHWHGMHVPAVMDGGPHQPIDPGATWQARFRVMNRAGTYWYHPHLHPPVSQGAIFDPESTGYQVYEGLAGMLIVEDETSDALPLPRSYGKDDIPLILQDRRFHPDGSFLHFPDDFNAETDPALRKGDHFLVNGVEGAVLEVGAQVVRLRILNASNARVYNLRFDDDRTFHQIASDGGFLSNPVPMTRLILAPAERAELLIDLNNDEGNTLTLGSFNANNGTAFVPTRLKDQWDTADFRLLEIKVGPASADAVKAIRSSLTPVSRIRESEAQNAGNPRLFELGVNPFQINGNRMDMSVINERIALGATEIWEISNPNRQAHPFHIHGESFQILSRNGAVPAENELGWKDVVLTRPNETVRIIKRFNDFADPDLPYMYHCHILEHEDVGMMGRFVVEDT